MRKKAMEHIIRQNMPDLLPKKNPGRIKQAIKNVKARRAKKRWLAKQEALWPRYGIRARKWKNPERIDKRVLAVIKDGTIGMQLHRRNQYFERVIGKDFTVFRKKGGKMVPAGFSKKRMREAFPVDAKGEITISKKYMYVPVGMAMRNAFASIELPPKAKRIEVSKIVEGMLEKGLISVDGKTSAAFTGEAKARIRGILAPRGNEFMALFEKYLSDSTNWVKDYVHRKTEDVLKEPWDDAQ